MITNFFDDVSLTKAHIKLILIIALAMIFEQADNYNFSFVAPSLREYWGLSVQQIGVINSLFSTGMLLGTLFFGIISDKIGRKKTILGAAFIFSIGSLLNGLAPNVELFMVMRFITGLGISGVLIVAPAYMMEMLPSKGRGRIFGIATTVGFIGIPVIAVLCNIILPMGGEHWRFIYVIGAVGLVLVILGAAWLKESPRWLVRQGRVKEAEKIVEEIVGEEYKADLSHVEVPTEKVSFAVLFRELFRRGMVKNTLVLMVACTACLSCGLLFVNMASTLLVDNGYTMEQGLRLSSLLSVGLLLGPVITSFIAEMGGRKLPIAVMTAGMGVALIVYTHSPNFTVMCIAAVLATAMNQTAIVILNAYAPETFPTKIRNAAVSIVTAFGRVTTIISMTLFPVLYVKVGFVNAYLCLTAFDFVAALCVGFFGKRTSGVCLEDLEHCE